MNAIEILGELLGRKAAGSDRGADVLRDIFGSGHRRDPRSASSSDVGPLSQNDIQRQAKELEDLLNVAKERRGQRPAEPSGLPPRYQEPSPADRGFAEASRAPSQRKSPPPTAGQEDEQAWVLVRAMVNAAKSDGQINQQEQQAILQQLGQLTAEDAAVLRAELTKPLDVREFTWSVPLGMEQQVYALSLMTIRLDSNAEASYLNELAHGLRLSPETRQQIHQRYGAPAIR
jgi:hypothetical protein